MLRAHVGAAEREISGRILYELRNRLSGFEIFALGFGDDQRCWPSTQYSLWKFYAVPANLFPRSARLETALALRDGDRALASSQKYHNKTLLAPSRAETSR